MSTSNEFKQKRRRTCGISVLRNMIFDLKKIKLSEDEMMQKVKDHNFVNNDPIWKENFLKDIGPMPTINLRELLENEFQIPCEINNNIPTSQIKPPVLALLEETKGNYHAIYITQIDTIQNKVSYMDPSIDKKDVVGSINDIDEKRTMKQNNTQESFEHILSTL